MITIQINVQEFVVIIPKLFGQKQQKLDVHILHVIMFNLKIQLFVIIHLVVILMENCLMKKEIIQIKLQFHSFY